MLGILVAVVQTVFGLAFLSFGGILLYAGIGGMRMGKQIQSSEVDSASDAAFGEEVHLEGTAKPIGQTLEGPVSGDTCLAYEYEVRTNDGDGDGIVDSGGTNVPFLLETETGRSL